MESVYLIQETVERGPREFAHAYRPIYITRAVCTSEDQATKLRDEVFSQHEREDLILLKVPFDEVFPRNLQVPAKETRQTLSSITADAAAGSGPNLQVNPATYERDRKIREAEMMKRWNIAPLEH